MGSLKKGISLSNSARSLALAAMVLGAAAKLPATTIAFTFVNPPTGTTSSLGNDGFRFTPNVTIWVTALGYYDRNQDGLTLQHPVAIFDLTTTNQVAAATAGPGSTLSGLFRYTAITPVRLTAGRQYIVVGHHPGSNTEDLAAYLSQAPTSGSGITYQGYYYDYGATIDLPTTNGGFSTPFFGPNFQFDAVPEPAAFYVVPPGLALLIIVGRRRRGSGDHFFG
jgi:hypothetical protein